mmetsp:Transcript_18369/g.53612  ORF Transcript_18369/g.53612 Transcript_18369/m.53612 type:complete len:159 (+) Transcript_18369:320-796(+)
MRKGGRKVVLLRMLNQNRTQLKAYADKANSELKALQDKYRKLTLADIANADETGWDICALSSAMVYVFLKVFGNLVAVPVDQSPHFTFVVGHAGGKRMCILMIIQGPRAHGAQRLPHTMPCRGLHGLPLSDLDRLDHSAQARLSSSFSWIRPSSASAP